MNNAVSSRLFPSQEKISSVVPIILLFIALIALSCTAIFIKISVAEISANATVFNRLWLATLVFGIWNISSQIRQHQSLKDQQNPPPSLIKSTSFKTIGLFVAVALVHVTGRFLWTWSLTQTSAANSTVLANLTPIFTTIGGGLFLQQYFDRRFAIGLVFAILGATTLGVEDWQISFQSLIGDGAALLSALFYTASFLLVEQLRNKFSSQEILIWRCLIGTIVMIPVVLLVEDQMFPISWIGWLSVIGLAVICEGLGHGLVVYSLKRFSSSFVTLFLLLEPVIVAILAWILFAEQLSLLSWVAFALILAGIYLAKTGKGAEKA